MDKLEKQKCPVCGEEKLTLLEDEMDIPYFGKTYIFSMKCDSCNYAQSDIEAEETKDPCKIEFTVENKKDLSVRIVKSSEGSVKIPQLKMSVDPGVASEGYVSNVEGLLERFKKILESERDNADDEDVRKKAKNLLKRLWKIELGEEKVKMIFEDPSGNSAIISEKAVVSRLKK